MKKNFFFVALFALLTLYACQTDKREDSQADDNEEVNTEKETPAKMIELLVGDWQLDGAQGANSQQQAGAGDRLTFTEEARYILKSGDQKVDSGAYQMNEQLRNLYLESEGDKQRREYEVTLNQDVLTLKPRQGNQANAQDTGTYTYRRIGPGSISPDKRGEQ